MKSLFAGHLKSGRSGFTLIELTFSISFYTMIVVTALAVFIGVLNLYNRAQGVTRTQLQSRTAMDALVRDLRNAKTIESFATGAASPARSDALAGSAIDVFCLSGDGFSRGYASLFMAATKRYHLVRMQSCTSFTNYELLIGPDVWADVSSAGAGAAGLLPADRKPLQITRVTTLTATPSSPAVWRVRVSAHRGTRVPGVPGQENITDPLSAETILESVVATRK